jgi:hypothetical protein
MTKFPTMLRSDTSIEPKALQLGNVSVSELVARIGQAYELDLPAQVKQ